MKLELNIEESFIRKKIEWVNNNTDINYQGESEGFRLGFATALEWLLEQK